MQIDTTAVADVLILTPRRFGDDRGWFSEVYRDDVFREAAGDVTFVQDNQSLSRAAGTVRGLHFQRHPKAQGKLVRCVRGALLDVAVDIRVGSPTFGRHVAVELSADNGRQLWLPVGFAHGFCSLQPDTEILYKVTDTYSAADDGGILWDDPDLGIAWPVAPDAAVLSEKDRRLPRLSELPPLFPYRS
ncbi:dTDP-4-dehydrorhamnose 3,5-epimerase [Chthonobacter rhizosphaerae]|uniref:dTDP-4-dehydrorhamnose 3,5-epimerase n=1 Tax=Chthonobacter rhizosphaerae TaxID=2735553 RepID=UPI0015EF0BF3|nr:dTDP-4-dehydrorhamnose 3,5-epimerase [Chthonobacter rhizosphaerae]